MPRTIRPSTWDSDFTNSIDRYAPVRKQGKKVSGWEDINITKLAHDTGISFRYLLAVLSGQRNCTLALLQKTAHALGIELSTLVIRVETASRLRLLESAAPLDKNERRRLQSEKRATRSR